MRFVTCMHRRPCHDQFCPQNYYHQNSDMACKSGASVRFHGSGWAVGIGLGVELLKIGCGSGENTVGSGRG